MSGKGTINVVFMLQRLQEQHCAKTLYMYSVNVQKTFDRVLKIVLEWAMRKKGIL